MSFRLVAKSVTLSIGVAGGDAVGAKKFRRNVQGKF